MMNNSFYQTLEEIDNRVSYDKNKLNQIRNERFNKSKNFLISNKFNVNKINKELDEISIRTLRDPNYKINENLEKISIELKNKLDSINDNNTSKIVILNFISYIFDFLVWNLCYLTLKKFKIGKAYEISSIITSFIVYPLVNEISNKTIEKGKYESNFISSYLGRSFSIILNNFIFHSSSGSIKSQIIFSISGFVIDKLRWIYNEELNNTASEKTIIALRNIVSKCYIIIFNIINMLDFIPGSK